MNNGKNKAKISNNAILDIIDISPLISNNLAVFPGDVPFKRSISRDFSNNDSLMLSAMSATLHLGAHTDAPNHYHPQGQGIDRLPLHYYLGPCQIIPIENKKPRARIKSDDIKRTNIKAPRIIFKTNSFPNPDQWSNDFVALSASLINYLANCGVVLVGIDTPSIDPASDKILESHQAVYQHGMAILEGVILTGVDEGLYTLIALPLKIKDGDASPVRAVLVRDKC